MKKYRVNVNGTNYEVELELVSENDVKSAAQSAAPVAPAAPAAPAVAAAPVGGETVKAPMPGPILDVKVAAGAAVKKGDVLMILEAMKMENEILSPCDGTVAAVNVSKGTTVETGAVLCVIK